MSIQNSPKIPKIALINPFGEAKDTKNTKDFLYSNSGIPGDILNEFSGCFLKDVGGEILPPLVRDDSGTRGGNISRNSVDCKR